LVYFSPFTNVSETWSKGEVGDFIGGGLGGIAVLGVIFTIKLQMNQLKEQEKQDAMATTLRVYELLKPEIENLSSRIIKKIKLGQLKGDDNFDEMLKKFKANDRTVFLRAMQKHNYKNPGVFAAAKDRDQGTELHTAIKRFTVIMDYFDNELENVPGDDHNGFTGAIKQTEIYKTYKDCFTS
jgi:hypothetical protein